MTLEPLGLPFTVCKVPAFSPEHLLRDFCFLACTDGENSLVCPTACVPADALAREDGWLAFRVAGTLDFALTGILARISTLLAERGIGLFAVSTYDTDYVLTKAERFEEALRVLSDAGYEIARKTDRSQAPA